MIIHKEGRKIISWVALFVVLFNVILYFVIPESVRIIFFFLALLSLVFLLAVISFFRIPKRNFTLDHNLIVSPADGTIVAIEEVMENEYFGDRRIQVSIFMSPANVHNQRSPVKGKVLYHKYHPGKYLVAWHPKSSELNERWSTVIGADQGSLLIKQIAGAVARRIANYTHPGQMLNQTEEFGFIRFGSRVDVLLPLGTPILVKINQSVKGGIDTIASWH